MLTYRVQTAKLHCVPKTTHFEYFCQISSKSILIISSYSVSKLVRFLGHSVDYASITKVQIVRTCPVCAADE